MAIKLINNEWNPLVGRKKEFLLDTEADVSDLPESAPGSAALIAATGSVYIVNASGRWVEFGGEA